VRRNLPAVRLRGYFLATALAFLVGAFAVWAGPIPAHADGEITVGLAEPDDAAFPELSFVVTADRAGRPLTQLAVENVLVTEGGRPATVTSVRRAQDSGIPLALVVTIDTSGSMQGASMTQAKAAASALVQRLASADSAAVVEFNSQARVVAPLTRDRASLQNVINGLVPIGNTALYDAVAESARIAAQSGSARRAVVLLSDGLEFGGASRLTREQALESAAQGGAVFYMVGVGADIDRAFLEEIANRSGGRFFQASGASEVPQIYAALEELLRGQFVVTARSSAPPEGAVRQLRVEIREAGGQGAVDRQYNSKRPAAATAAPPAPVATAPPTAVAPKLPVAPIEEESGGVPVLPLALGGVVVLGLAAYFWRQRMPTVLNDAPPVRVTRRGSVDLPPAAGVLRITSGAGAGAHFELAEAPATIGSAENCAVRIAAGEGVAAEHARLWWRDGKPMLHHIAEGYETRVNGRTIDWASLDVGYEIEIGPVKLQFDAPSLPVDIQDDPPRALRPGA
jgi:VWFA-related protein